jgi:serine/threonine protein kinase
VTQLELGSVFAGYRIDFRERFIDESQVAASLDHPNVIPIDDSGEVDGILFLAMRHVNAAT